MIDCHCGNTPVLMSDYYQACIEFYWVECLDCNKKSTESNDQQEAVQIWNEKLRTERKHDNTIQYDERGVSFKQ